MKVMWTDGKIITMVSEGDTVEAVLTENGSITMVGKKEELAPFAEKEISLQGAAMYPGFVDSHIHLIGHGEKLSYYDLSHEPSIEQIVKGIEQRITKGLWYIAEGWDDNRLEEKRQITMQDLQHFTDTPIVLKRICRHVLVANKRAMELAGISETIENPKGGVIGRDEDGRLNGLFYDEAQKLITDAIPSVTPEYLSKVIARSIRDLQEKGFTGVHTEDMSYYGPYTVPLEAYRNTVKEGFRVHLLRHHLVFEQMVHEKEEDFIEFGAMKIFIDGSLGGRTALLSKEYSDEPGNKGIAVHTKEKLRELVKLARKHGENIAVHVIGDKATEIILELIEDYPVPPGKKDRLIHVNVLREDLIDKMKQLPLVLDIQPIFVSSDFPWVQERLGKDRLTYSYAWKTLLEAGFECSGGSDSPIEDANPILGIHAAVNNNWLKEQSLSVYEAVSLFTTGSAQAIGKEEARGKISIGYAADFTVFDEAIEKSNVLERKVVMTVVDGKVVYRKS